MHPIVTVGDLARALGLRMEELVPHGMYSMGSIQGPRASAEYAWDMYHEAPVETLGALAGRRLISYQVPELGLEWHASDPQPPGDVQALLDRIAGASAPGRIHLDAPVPALALARALGEPAPTARTVDVHMSSWRMQPLEHGRWQVNATLYGPPGGPDIVGEHPPAARVAYVGEDATIVSLELTPPPG
jgi:hypothetical protein